MPMNAEFGSTKFEKELKIKINRTDSIPSFQNCWIDAIRQFAAL